MGRRCRRRRSIAAPASSTNHHAKTAINSTGGTAATIGSETAIAAPYPRPDGDHVGLPAREDRFEDLAQMHHKMPPGLASDLAPDPAGGKQRGKFAKRGLPARWGVVPGEAAAVKRVGAGAVVRYED